VLHETKTRQKLKRVEYITSSREKRGIGTLSDNEISSLKLSFPHVSFSSVITDL
jgi:hypothetical protein